MGVSSDDAETGKDGLIIVKQGWFDRIFGFFMRAQLDSDLMGSSSNQPVGESAHSNAIARSGSAAVTPMDVKEPELRLAIFYFLFNDSLTIIYVLQDVKPWSILCNSL
eukprot:gene9960-11010_t